MTKTVAVVLERIRSSLSRSADLVALAGMLVLHLLALVALVLARPQDSEDAGSGYVQVTISHPNADDVWLTNSQNSASWSARVSSR